MTLFFLCFFLVLKAFQGVEITQAKQAGGISWMVFFLFSFFAFHVAVQLEVWYRQASSSSSMAITFDLVGIQLPSSCSTSPLGPSSDPITPPQPTTGKQLQRQPFPVSHIPSPDPPPPHHRHHGKDECTGRRTGCR